MFGILQFQQVFGSLNQEESTPRLRELIRKIEGLSFNEAKQQWLERCANNPDALRALSHKTSLPKNNLRITEDEYGLLEES